MRARVVMHGDHWQVCRCVSSVGAGGRGRADGRAMCIYVHASGLIADRCVCGGGGIRAMTRTVLLYTASY